MRGARIHAIGAVASVVVGWGVAQWPYILPETLKVSQAAAPSGTLTTLLVAAICALVIVLPGFILLYTLDQKSLLPAEGSKPGWRLVGGILTPWKRSRFSPLAIGMHVVSHQVGEPTMTRS